MYDRMKFGAKLRDMREKQLISIMEQSKDIGIGISTLLYLDHKDKQYNLSNRTIKRILAYLEANGIKYEQL